MLAEALQCPGVERYQGVTRVADAGSDQSVKLNTTGNGKGVDCPALEIGGTCAISRKRVLKDSSFTPTLCPFGPLASAYPELGIVADQISAASKNKSFLEASQSAPVMLQESPLSPVMEETEAPVVETPVSALNIEQPEEEQVIPEVLAVEKDVPFKPFEHAKGFMATGEDIARAYEDEVREQDLPVLLRQEIDFLGIRGTIEIIPDITGEDLAYYYNESDKPLGPVQWLAESEGRATTYPMLPVKVRVSFETRKFKQYNTLQQHLLELVFGDESYFLTLSRDEYNDEYEKDDFKGRKKGDELYFSDTETRTSDDMMTRISLPMDFEKLRTIQMRIVENSYYEDNSEEDN